MNDADSKIVCDMITDIFPSRSWEDIEEVEPNEVDLEMLHEIADNPDCSTFVSEEKAMKMVQIPEKPPVFIQAAPPE